MKVKGLCLVLLLVLALSVVASANHETVLYGKSICHLVKMAKDYGFTPESTRSFVTGLSSNKEARRSLEILVYTNLDTLRRQNAVGATTCLSYATDPVDSAVIEAMTNYSKQNVFPPTR